MSVPVRLRDLGSTYGGLTGKTKVDFGRGSASFVTFLEVINNTRLRGTHLQRVRIRKGERQNRVHRGDILFNGSSETPDEVALSAVVDFDPDSTTYLNSFCFGYRLRPDAQVDPTYLAYLFRSGAGRALVASLAQGAIRYNIAKTKFLNVELLLPTITRQLEIAAALSDADDLIVSFERLISKKHALKVGMMQQLLTGRTRLPGFTDPWSSTTLGQLGVFFKGRGVRRDDVRSTGIGCIRYGELYTEFDNYTSTTRSFVSSDIAATALPIRWGDLLFAGSGETREEIGMCVAFVGDDAAVAGGDIVVLRGASFNPVYLATLANTPDGRRPEGSERARATLWSTSAAEHWGR
ncbi:MAG: hypothetical protein V9F04_11095 [Dermatophilaceae bacterium]